MTRARGKGVDLTVFEDFRAVTFRLSLCRREETSISGGSAVNVCDNQSGSMERLLKVSHAEEESADNGKEQIKMFESCHSKPKSTTRDGR